MPSLQAITRERRQLEDRQKQLAINELALIKRIRVTCNIASCQKTSALGKWGFVQGHWYTPPRGCTEGDHWNLTKVECCHIVCPQCKTMNYIYNHPAKPKLLKIEARLTYRFIEVFDQNNLWDQHGDKPATFRIPEEVGDGLP